MLLVVVFAALNPAQRLADTRNAHRWNDVNQILTAIHECLVDNQGTYATCGLTADGTTRQIVNTNVTTGCNAAPCATLVTATGNCAYLDELTTLQYIASLPTDPGGISGSLTEYTVGVSTGGIVTVSSCSGESETITVAR